MTRPKKQYVEDIVGSMPLMRYDVYYHYMPDGTIKQINPFTGTEVWSVPGRSSKPLDNEIPHSAKPLDNREVENYCSFCQSRYYDTPPEKSRIVLSENNYLLLEKLNASEYNKTVAEFRRTPNLFEIVTLNYWRQNYNFKMTKNQLDWREKYLSDQDGIKHVLNVVDYKLARQGKNADEIKYMSVDEKLTLSDAFFGGSHDLIIAKRHFKPSAKYDSQLSNSGELTTDEHFQYFRYTINSLSDVYTNNRYVRYVSVFQNWLKPAGASFDHLHKQLVGLDSWSLNIENQIQMARNNPNVFNEFGPNFAIHHNLVFAENDYAIAYCAIGHRYPTIAIYSKSHHSRPQEHTNEEIRGVSDLVHACHTAMGSMISCNEEWNYTPIDAVYNIPWRVLIKWRINIPAGFEGNTGIYINPISPHQLRDKLVPKLYEMRSNGELAYGIQIAEECPCQLNCLSYHYK